ncbi:MAG: DUF1269 domain-containing protein [Acidimicrobiales bacterium]
MAVDTLVTMVATYPSKDQAEADFTALKEFHEEVGLLNGYDAAVVEKTDDGKVRIAKSHETPTEASALAGGGLGLAAGLVAALFPAVALTGGLVAGTTVGGAALGALTGHVAAGFNRGDLKDIGEVLDAGAAGLVFVGVADTEARVRELLDDADDLTVRELKADRKQALADATAAS